MTDFDIRDAVLAAFEAHPEFDGASIGVSVRHGVVTLSGRTGSFADKAALSRIALRAEGVRGVANEIDVCCLDESYVPDEVIATQVVDHLREPAGDDLVNVRVLVSHGVATLAGAVQHEQQRAALFGFVRGLEGVEQVVDHVAVRDGHGA